MSARKNSGETARANGRAIIQSIANGVSLEGVGADVLGFKAYNLARMAQIGLNVPAAFVLGTGWCFRKKPVEPSDLQAALEELEALTGMRFGDSRRPLLLSVRSGAPVSMPGMMETLLNIGLNETSLHGLVRQTGNPRLAFDSYRRLISGFGEVVAGIDAAHFEADLDSVRDGLDERALDFAALKALAARHLDTFRREAGEDFPQDAQAQLSAAISAVFKSWDSAKAKAYREMRNLKHSMGTAVTVQQMVFGNGGGLSGAGVGFTRNPSTGAPALWVDFLFNAQGEDVVSGRRSAQGHAELENVAPSLWRELEDAAQRLEHAFLDMQDFEFTIQEGRLFMLQTRTGKRTAQAQGRIALDLFDEGVIGREDALSRTAELDEDALSLFVVAAEDGGALEPLAKAYSASSGAICGEIALTDARAVARKAAGAQIILVRRDAETRDVAILEQVDALLTQRGARTSHAAVVARQLGKVCLVGCEDMVLDEATGEATIAGRPFRDGDLLTLDGNDGLIFAGKAAVCKTVDQDLLRRLNALRAGAAVKAGRAG